MIHSLSANKPSFRTLSFTRGLNVITADKTEKSSDRDSRNGLGKSLLIDIIHFCLGGSIRSSSPLSNPILRDWAFTLDLSLAGRRITITRNVENHRSVILRGAASDLQQLTGAVSSGDRTEIRTSELKEILGEFMFDLPRAGYDHAHKPTFRSLISFFSRREAQAYLNPFRTVSQQTEIDCQVNNAYLLDLAWEYDARLRALLDKEKSFRKLLDAQNISVFGEAFGRQGELEAHRIRLEEETRSEFRALKEFRVHPTYKNIEENSNTVTARIHELNNLNIVDGRRLRFYENSTATEQLPDGSKVLALFAEIERTMPDFIARRLEDLKAFHRQLISNRKAFLANEIERLRDRIERRTAEIQGLDAERALALEILSTHGALEEYTTLQERHSAKVSQLHEIEEKIKTIRNVQEWQSRIRIDKEHLIRAARQDLEERHHQREAAISLFNSNSQRLYDAPGNLVVDYSDTGIRYDVVIDRSGSQGIQNMKIFCYDLMLAQLWSSRTRSPGFLIHDSFIFDGVDGRQVARALELAEEESSKKGFQYICTMNTDRIPRDEFRAAFDLDRYVIMTLRDVRETETLLGIRF
ncbi:MAG: DUF2326 domain-containing protein [bacterium]|nr:DUF2326 domain-containing protein [bacterium]